MPAYEVVSACAELPRCSFFSAVNGPIRTGALILARINDLLIVGRWFPNVADFHWILQPDRIIRITGRAIVKILGVIAPFEAYALNYSLSQI